MKIHNLPRVFAASSFACLSWSIIVFMSSVTETFTISLSWKNVNPYCGYLSETVTPQALITLSVCLSTNLVSITHLKAYLSAMKSGQLIHVYSIRIVRIDHTECQLFNVSY